MRGVTSGSGQALVREDEQERSSRILLGDNVQSEGRSPTTARYR
jgi:hypothetical protein